MRKELSPQKKRKFFLLISLALGFLLLLGGCATTPADQLISDKPEVPVIESIKVSPSPVQTVIEIINTRSAPYTAFRLSDPPRIIVDIRGEPGVNLPLATNISDGNVKEIRFEEGKSQAMTTRMVIDLDMVVDYQVKGIDNVITLELTPKRVVTRAPEPKEVKDSAIKDSGETEFTPSKPRIFFEPKASDLNQVLGIDFTMLEQGKSRMTVSTDRKVRYDLDRKGPKTLILKLPRTSIPPQLTREIDSSNFIGAVDRIKPAFSPEKKEVSIAISLREMVPFHVKQTDSSVTIDFARTSVMPSEKKIVPLQLAQAQAKPGPPGQQQAPGVPGLPPSRYTGAPMTMDFVNADVTNILRLIGEVSNLNIVWGPEVTGKVSMRLRNVPWDQALEMILDNNKLGKRQAGNVIWISTKANIAQIEAEEKARQEAFEAEIKRKEEEARKAKEVKKEVTLTTGYIPVDFATANDIMAHIVLSAEGKAKGASKAVDTRTNTIIVHDTAESIEAAKKITKKFDAPVKQVMIEARIVDATKNFTRDLGIQWDFQRQIKNHANTPWDPAGPGWASQSAAANYPDGGSVYNPTFSTNLPAGVAPNIGLIFTKLSTFGLTGMVLDAQLALAEVTSDVKTIAAPKVIASNGEAATISRGDSLIIAATENVESTTIDATLSLTVTPTVSYNNFVSLEVAVTDDSAPSATTLLKKAITTKMMIKSGDTVVIGGIYTENKSKNNTGIPFLQDIPLLGWLFKAQRNTDNRTELLIFITPTVLPPPDRN